MSLGTPIVFSEGTEKPKFLPLAAVSARRDDPNFFKEWLLQELVDSTPNVLPVREYLPSTTALFSLGREIPLDLGGALGRIDNLLVTNDGYLVIVETKLYRNPEGIREVIAQTLQYGMAVGQMTILNLEDRIRRGQAPALKSDESIHDCVARLAGSDNQSAVLADDFEEALERHLRRGEILLLIVSDGIHVGVERVTHWLNEQGNSSPFKLGLVELKFYAHGNQRVVVPRTVLKTREVSRHVVVVDIQRNADVSATSTVIDEYRNLSGGKTQKSRSIRAASVPIDQSQLLQLIAQDDLKIASMVIDQLEAYGFDQGGTATYLQFGFSYPADDGEFYPLTYLGKTGVWVFLPKRVKELLGADEILTYHRNCNQFGEFFRPNQLGNPESSGCEVKYRQLGDSAQSFVAFLDAYRTKIIGLLQDRDGVPE